MNVTIAPAGPADHPRIEALLQLYAHDFSEFLGVDVGEDGRFALPASMTGYASDPRCHPFVVNVDGKLAGFAFVRQGSRLTKDETTWDMAEFFVLRKYRRRGVGEQAALLVFASFPGLWEVRERRENTPAIAFWTRIIGRLTGGKFEAFDLDDERWRGAVQRFEMPAPR
jgi:predicted acetyltransferase